MTDHEKGNVKLKMEIANKVKDALTREAYEAVRIYSRTGPQSLNSKIRVQPPTICQDSCGEKTLIKS